MTHPDYTIRPASTDDHLRAILALQRDNLLEHVDPAERAAQGFVSLRHDLDLLRDMNAPHPHAIALHRPTGAVAAYALVTLRHFRARIPVLEPMFARLDSLAFEGRPLAEQRWCVMGQVCVARDHRARGLVDALYASLCAQLAPSFDLFVTEIDHANPRSLRAHEKAGFITLDDYTDADRRRWRIVALDLRPHS